MEKKLSIISHKKAKSLVEKTAAMIFRGCAIISVLAVVTITGYMIISGTPAIFKEGITGILFSTTWAPTAANPQYGIAYVILTSIVGVFLAICIGVPIGLFTAINLAEIAPVKLRKILKSAIELLAGIPSVVYGLLGILIVNPMMYKLELMIYHGSKTHQFTGGANLLSAIIVLAIMILPTLFNISIFKVVVPSAKSGIMSAIVLGVGRAIGEAMAILLVAGNAVSLPLPFNSVRFLTTAIVSEMGYASGTHRQVLFTIGLVLFIFIMIINLILTYVLKRGDLDE